MTATDPTAEECRVTAAFLYAQTRRPLSGGTDADHGARIARPFLVDAWEAVKHSPAVRAALGLTRAAQPSPGRNRFLGAVRALADDEEYPVSVILAPGRVIGSVNVRRPDWPADVADLAEVCGFLTRDPFPRDVARPLPAPFVVPDVLHCRRCDSDLPRSAFAIPADVSTPGRLPIWCRECRAPYNATWRAEQRRRAAEEEAERLSRAAARERAREAAVLRAAGVDPAA
jgi:hypothetical protein